MNRQEMRQFVEKYIKALNTQDPDEIEKFHADNSVSVSVRVREQRMEREERRRYHEDYRKSFPDAHITVEAVIADPEGETVAYQWLVRATHKGDFMGMKATKRQAAVRGCSVLEIRKDKIVHEVSYSDSAAFMQQLGLLSRDIPMAGARPEGEAAANASEG